ncbi:RagB/SusD family nutrient uptake outer membrane protein [Puia sp. P3]|uniref:RagB/SusD family nutrient uptake outer membrane protein n=1 Tax=Puia sp. P3 TaxID=3423952 RepID=UPI003D67BF10
MDQTPQNAVSSGDFKNASDAEAAIVGAYSLMANSVYWYYNWNYLLDGDVRADNCYSGGSAPDIDAIDNFTSVATDNQPISEDWYELYMDIGACNSVLDNVPAITDALLTATRKAQILGEAKFLRAYHYSHLVRNYGAVVLQLHTIVSDQHTLKARSPVDSVYAQIIADLKDAEAALPVTYADRASSHSRATKGAAEAVLAKVYAQTGDYTNCLDYCNRVLPPSYGGTGTAGYRIAPQFRLAIRQPAQEQRRVHLRTAAYRWHHYPRIRRGPDPATLSTDPVLDEIRSTHPGHRKSL